MQQGLALPAPTGEGNGWYDVDGRNPMVRCGKVAVRYDSTLTRHAVRIFSISSALRTRGGCPNVRISEMGTPKGT